MRDPTQEEIDVVTSVSMCDQHEAVAVIQALDAHHGECVPIDKLRAFVVGLWKTSIARTVFLAWLDRRGWLDETGKAGT
jgi:hypothetical protein